VNNEPSWAHGREKPPVWTGGEGSTRFDNPWLGVVEYEATAPTGHRTRYGVVRFKNLAVGVLPIFEDGTVVLVGQQRFPLMNYSWEMPEGGSPLEEDPLEGAKRELREEAGLVAEDWIRILELELSNSVTDERGVCYLARGLSSCEGEPDCTESLEVVRVPFRQLLAAITAGAVRDSLTVAAALRVYHMAREGELAGDLARVVLG
jgi:8-oxo-dGTP pyrophosphatase MutT (NUDIX family)